MMHSLLCHTGDCGRLVDPNQVEGAAWVFWGVLVVVLLFVVAGVVLLIRVLRKTNTPDDAADQAEQAEDSASERPRGPSI